MIGIGSNDEQQPLSEKHRVVIPEAVRKREETVDGNEIWRKGLGA